MAGAAQPASAADRLRFVLDPARTTIRFELPAFLHTVHGSFLLKRGTVELDAASGEASGEIVVDLAGGQTGNASRDRRMHGEVLETARYPEADLILRHVTGAVAPGGDSTIEMAAILRLHGAEHAVTLPLKVHAESGEASVTGRFEVPYVSWGLKDPSTTLLRVGKSVKVEIQARGRVEPAP